MNVLHESLRYENPLVPMRIFTLVKPDNFCNKWHYHKQIEVLYILEGQLDVYVEQDMFPLGKGDVVLIGPNQLHRDRAHSVKYIVFQFDLQQYTDPTMLPYLKIFMSMSSPLSKLNYMFSENGEVKQTVATTIQSIYQEARGKKNGYEIAISMHIRQLLLTFMRNDTLRLLPARERKEMSLLKPVFDYVEKNIAGKPDLEKASKMANLSYYHFTKCFKQAIGMSFVNYVNHCKIKMAERLLLTEDLSIEQVGERIGMLNMGHFYKTFKKYNGCSPKEFRKKMNTWSR
ncbi:HTH-type transcriptional activator RhaR [Paenibacillus solanacearum]|uniref:HTH-type transcriptional activator RhaR n=1 Tax=Paenibacillus solanacearum TaxID=2048548 RepID=A0A916K4I0_9BACL|nr:AraC family transcriptional regulator [Paenibacillus solanacearum]CAG7637676.1 HTH-type transcriptional activator RhaR [Paenibacillus solanacearum]